MIPTARTPRTPDRCAATAGKRYQQSRLGWAAQTLGETCYESNGRPRRYSPVCERKYSWGTAKEDYVLPEAHTVAIRIAPEQLANVTGDCTWSWQPRKTGGKPEATRSRPRSLPARTSSPSRACLTRRTAPIPASRSRSSCPTASSWPSGTWWSRISSSWRSAIPLPRAKATPTGRCNSAPSREMVYDPTLLRERVAARTPAKSAVPSMSGYGLASSDDQYNPKVLPRRLMDDEVAERFHRLASPEFLAAFDKAAARWLSRDCHRSQYGYPFRVGDRARAGEPSSLGDARELDLLRCRRWSKACCSTWSRARARARFCGGKVLAQLDQLSELLCRGARSHGASYALPIYSYGSTQISDATDRQEVVSAAGAQACDRRRFDVDRWQRRGLRRARGLCLDRRSRRPRPDRRLGRKLARASARRCRASTSTCWTSHEGGERRAARRVRRSAVARRADVLRADPIRRDRRAVRHAAHAGHGRASRSQAQPAAAAGDR